MLFEHFASAHGLIIQSLQFGKWCRCPTEDKPHKKNGAYKHLGDVAFVQNHATMAEPATWFPDSSNDIRIDREQARRAKERADRELAENRLKAARTAQKIVGEAKHDRHAYLDSKGFHDAIGLVWMKDENNILVIPMRVGKELVGVQMIDRDGNKQFLFGQRCSGAEYVIDAKGPDVWCEGYATGLSIQACLHAMKVRYRIHVCFSAGNMRGMAKQGFVVADNDESDTGRQAAIATGLPFWISDQQGEDFNDLHRRLGTFRAASALVKAMRSG